jgi:hypothetical protein
MTAKKIGMTIGGTNQPAMILTLRDPMLQTRRGSSPLLYGDARHPPCLYWVRWGVGCKAQWPVQKPSPEHHLAIRAHSSPATPLSRPAEGPGDPPRATQARPQRPTGSRLAPRHIKRPPDHSVDAARCRVVPVRFLLSDRFAGRAFRSERRCSSVGVSSQSSLAAASSVNVRCRIFRATRIISVSSKSWELRKTGI